MENKITKEIILDELSCLKDSLEESVGSAENNIKIRHDHDKNGNVVVPASDLDEMIEDAKRVIKRVDDLMKSIPKM